MHNMKPGQPRPRTVKHRARKHATLIQRFGMLLAGFLIAADVVVVFAVALFQLLDPQQIAGLMLSSSLWIMIFYGLYSYSKWGTDD